MTVLRLLLSSSMLAFTAAAGATADPAFEGFETPILNGEAPGIQITGLDPEASVRVTAERTSPWRPDQIYRAEAVFRADDAGRIDPARQAPLSGSWSGVDPFGLLWSAERVDDAASVSTNPLIVRLHADLDMDGEADLEARLDMTGGLSEVEEIAVSPALPGAFFLRPAGEGPFPAVITLGGSEGGDSGARSLGANLAARGYAVLGLPYYSPAWYGQTQQFPGLPAAFADIPLDKAELARDWLVARDDVRADAIAIYGVSKGAEFALAAASRIDGFAAVAAIVPSDVIWEGWGAGTTPGEVSSFSWRGEPLEFVPYEGMSEAIAAIARGERRSIRPPHDDGRAANPGRVAPARIAVEAIDEPVFLLGGMVDAVWASGPMAANIVQARDAAGLTTLALIYEDAGHGLSGPPTTPSGAAEAAAKADAFPQLMAFFDRHLRAQAE